MEHVKLQRIVLEVFGGCNYTCSMCPQSHPGRGKNFTKKMNIKEIKVTNDEIKISYLDSSKDKRLKKGVDFEDNIKIIYKEINFIAKAS